MDAQGKYIQSNKFKKYVHKNTSTGETTEIDVGYERFLGPEMFFHPVRLNIIKIYRINIGIHPWRLESPIR
jgi:hypothetical protein